MRKLQGSWCVSSGAETGAGGRIRDTHATGKGSMMGVATAGYCVGNLRFPPSASEHRHLHRWGDPSFEYPENLALPTQILIEASNGASDYGNKFGEPVVAGFTRTFGQRMPDGSRREWIKPIMFRCVSCWVQRVWRPWGEGSVSCEFARCHVLCLS